MYDSPGRFTRATISAVTFVFVVVFVTIIAKYKNRLILKPIWQFRYRKHSGEDGIQDTIYMVENDTNLTGEFYNATGETEDDIENENGFRDVLLYSSAWVWLYDS